MLHPRQIDVVNRVFTPSAQEIEYARKVVAAYDEAEARGEASVAVDGKMVDIPIAVRARALIAMAEKIAAARIDSRGLVSILPFGAFGAILITELKATGTGYDRR